MTNVILFEKIGDLEVRKSKEAFIEGYDSVKTLSNEDFAVIPNLNRTRDITMLAWVYDRRDNPKLKSYLDKNIDYIVRDICSDSGYEI
ncbi:hypothetical protein N9W79_02245 [bacterium]|nr:hypothetical protein [bacterium]